MKVTRALGLAAAGALLVLAAPTERAAALSLASPGAAVAVQGEAGQPATQVHWHGGWHRGWHRGHHYGWRHHHRRWW